VDVRPRANASGEMSGYDQRMTATTRARTVLSWCGAIAFPFVLFGVLQATHGDSRLPSLLLAAATLWMPVALLRRRPIPALVLMLLGGFVALTTSQLDELGYLFVPAGDLAVGYLAATRSRRLSISAAALTLFTQAAMTAFYAHGSAVETAALLLVSTVVAAWLIGNSIRERREHAEKLQTQATVQAVTAERLRIARELHDMVAHSIGIIAIQAGVGGRVIDTQPDEARNALAAIEATSRETLAGLRRTLVALRRAEPELEQSEAPGLADLDRLAEMTLDAGVKVELCWQGRRRPLPAEIELSAFRIVQEAVTNVVRHADTAHCRVSIDCQDDELLIEIVDQGRGGVVVGHGYGLVGMRERVSLLHGDLSVGPRREGGFRVAARLPVPA
jgi:signal transduction histidine kinase